MGPRLTDTWDPAQYQRFQQERSAPFFDLLDLVAPRPGGRIADLGCGTGELTRVLHERTGAASTLGIDSSRAMLVQSAQHAGEGLTFEFDDIAEWAPSEPVDVVFSNAALHWIEDHEALLTRLTGALALRGSSPSKCPPTTTNHRSWSPNASPLRSRSVPHSAGRGAAHRRTAR